MEEAKELVGLVSIDVEGVVADVPEVVVLENVDVGLGIDVLVSIDVERVLADVPEVVVLENVDVGLGIDVFVGVVGM